MTGMRLPLFPRLQARTTCIVHMRLHILQNDLQVQWQLNSPRGFADAFEQIAMEEPGSSQPRAVHPLMILVSCHLANLGTKQACTVRLDTPG